MNIFESFRVALDMLLLHKLRAFLTMLGVIIGVMSVTLVLEVSAGFRHLLTDQIQKLGSDTIILFFDPGRNMKAGMGAFDKLSNDDIQYLRDRTTKVELVSGIFMVAGKPVRRGDRELKDPRVIATDENQAQLSRIGIKSGRHLSEEDVKGLANVCVIAGDVQERLFGTTDPIGKTVTFSGLTLEVVGIMDKVEMMGQSNGKDVWLPLTTAQKKWMGGEAVSYITCRPREGNSVQDGMDDVWQTMMTKSGNKPIYRVDSRESIINVLGVLVGGAGAMLAGVAALSLLVGGIGIMNIMLVSVTERTREIGLRKAVGARKSAILAQFLVESAMLALVGGLIGMAGAFLIGQLVTFFTAQAKQPAEGGFLMPFDVIGGLFAAGFSALIGIVFGIYPAARAAGLSPIEALRTE